MSIKALRIAALAETATYLVLMVAVVAKYGFGFEPGTQVAGPVHGVIFLWYGMLVLMHRDDLGWDARRTLYALGAAVIPFGGLLVERHYLEGNPALDEPTPA